MSLTKGTPCYEQLAAAERLLIETAEQRDKLKLRIKELERGSDLTDAYMAGSVDSTSKWRGKYRELAAQNERLREAFQILTTAIMDNSSDDKAKVLCFDALKIVQQETPAESLAERDRKLKAEAWDEGCAAAERGGFAENPYKENGDE